VHIALRTLLGSARCDKVRQLFLRIDANFDGSVSWDELLSFALTQARHCSSRSALLASRTRCTHAGTRIVHSTVGIVTKQPQLNAPIQKLSIAHASNAA
jgi:hypothetical protein